MGMISIIFPLELHHYPAKAKKIFLCCSDKLGNMTNNLSDFELQNILRGNAPAHACVFDGALPYVIPVYLLYLDGSVYIIPIMSKHQKLCKKYGLEVCLSVNNMPAEDEWNTVSIWGKCDEIKEDPYKQVILQGFNKKYAGENGLPGRMVAGWNGTVFQIDIKHKIGYTEKRALPALKQPSPTGKAAAILAIRA